MKVIDTSGFGWGSEKGVIEPLEASGEASVGSGKREFDDGE